MKEATIQLSTSGRKQVMDDNIKIYEVALGGLLHDIGKLMQRAGLEREYPEIKNNYAIFCPPNGYFHAAHTAYFVDHFIPDGLFPDNKAELYNAARHHISGQGDIYKDADCLSSGMDRRSRCEDKVRSESYKEVCLHSIFDCIELQYITKEKGDGNRHWVYKLVSESKRCLPDICPFIPKGNEKCAGEEAYKKLWKEFSKEVEEIRHIKNPYCYFNELYWLIKKYTSYIPSATNVFPDISLFDHLKTTAAIVSVLYIVKQNPENVEDGEFILYGGDISGIQNYIFKISRVQGIGHIAKRLRGRSFYIMMLSEALSRYIINEIGLTQANINFCGGGNFEILLPNTPKVEAFLNKFELDVNEWLLKEFHGELGFVSAYVKIKKKDFCDSYAEKRDELADKLEIAKRRKFCSKITDKDVWKEQTSDEYQKDICHSCNLNVVKKGKQFCKLCLQDEKLGRLLPKSNYIVFSQNKISNDSIEFGHFGYVTLLKKEKVCFSEFSFNSNQKPIFIYGLKEENSAIKAIYHLSQTVPMALEEMEIDTEEDQEGNKIVQPGQILSFSTLADMSLGDKKIGILKMDVDNLGLIFSLGLGDVDSGKVRSISRLASLSRQISSFFSLHLEGICERVFKEWKEDPENTWQYREKVSNIFYVLFAGGDDLVIIGPWEQIIKLAFEIQKAFRKFTCHNPNITLSAGIYICKPKYPVNHAIDKAEKALEQSKKKGKNRITVMGETFVWDIEADESKINQPHLKKYYKDFVKNECETEEIFLKGATEKTEISTLTFSEAMEFANSLDRLLKEKRLSHNFIRRLIETKKRYFLKDYNSVKDRIEESYNFMFLPFLVYNIERNLESDVKEQIKSKLITSGNAIKYIRQALFPCKYVLMKNRYR
jgi:CRISPR-associated protein Csm1